MDERIAKLCTMQAAAKTLIDLGVIGIGSGDIHLQKKVFLELTKGLPIAEEYWEQQKCYCYTATFDQTKFVTLSDEKLELDFGRKLTDILYKWDSFMDEMDKSFRELLEEA